MKNMALVMERSQHAFLETGEEALRMHFLVQLNGIFEGDATGETFNFDGKTDILIRKDGKTCSSQNANSGLEKKRSLKR